MKLTGKRVLITGGGSGIGLELALRLADDNNVVIAGRDEAKLERARAQTPTLQTLRLDVSSEPETRDAITWIASELGGLDLLVNNAGLFRSYPLRAADAERTLVDDVEVNVIGALRMTQLALPCWKTRRRPPPQPRRDPDRTHPPARTACTDRAAARRPARQPRRQPANR
jgi:uncharacterized oxidoreductase